MAGIGFLVLAAVAIVGLGILESAREQKQFRVTKYQLRMNRETSGSGKIKIVFLSDLHNQVYGRENQELYRAIEGEKPDVILIGGDMLIGKKGVPSEPALQFVKKLPHICPVYYANGNHEQRMKENPNRYKGRYKDYRKRLQKAGVCFLENKSVHLPIRGTVICISGLELPLYIYDKFKRHRMEKEDIENCIGKAAPDEYQILLAHNPVYFDVYRRWGADLVLSGHLHGGVVRIPGWRGLISPQFRLFPRYSGELKRKGDQAIIVSRGLGTHTIKIRLFNNPEIVSLCLFPKDAGL